MVCNYNTNLIGNSIIRKWNSCSESYWTICRLTGASQGIGERLAYEFAKYGAVLSLSARKEDQLKKLCESINRSGGQAKYYALDVTKIDQIEAVYKKVSPFCESFEYSADWIQNIKN